MMCLIIGFNKFTRCKTSRISVHATWNNCLTTYKALKKKSTCIQQYRLNKGSLGVIDRNKI